MTRDEYDKLCAPIFEAIRLLQDRHSKELAPWFQRLSDINSQYIPPIYVNADKTFNLIKYLEAKGK